MNGILEMILSTFAFSLMTLSVKLSSLNTANIILYRSLIQFIFTSISIKYKRIPLENSQMGILLCRGAVGAVEIGLFYYSVQHLKIEDATIIFLSAPILTTILSYFILGEQIFMQNIISLILCIVGSLLVAAPQFGKINAGVYAAIGGAITSSIVYILIKYLKSHALYSILSFNIFSALISSVEIAFTRTLQVPNDPWLILIIIFSYIGQYYLNTALQKIPASTGTLIVNLDVVFAFVYSVCVFQNSIDLNSCIGAALVMIGSMLSANAHSKEEELENEDGDEEEALLKK